jgi:hypothetical protein
MSVPFKKIDSWGRSLSISGWFLFKCIVYWRAQTDIFQFFAADLAFSKPEQNCGFSFCIHMGHLSRRSERQEKEEAVETANAACVRVRFFISCAGPLAVDFCK